MQNYLINPAYVILGFSLPPHITFPSERKLLPALSPWQIAWTRPSFAMLRAEVRWDCSPLVYLASSSQSFSLFPERPLSDVDSKSLVSPRHGGNAERINGAVESRASAITIAGFVRCREKKVGHVICGRAKENLVVREGCWDARAFAHRRCCASVCCIQIRSQIRICVHTRYVRFRLCEVAPDTRRSISWGKQTCSPSRGETCSPIIRGKFRLSILIKATRQFDMSLEYVDISKMRNDSQLY